MQLFAVVCRFPPWNVFPPLKPAFFFPNSAPLNSGLWLTAFGRSGLFRCQSGIRGLWLGAFGKSGLFRCQSRSFRPAFWLPLQPWFAKDTAFFSAKAQNSRIRLCRILGLFAGFFMEESCFCFWKAKETALLKKRQKSAFSKAGKDKGEGSFCVW